MIKNKMILVLIISVLIMAAIYLALPRIIIGVFARSQNLDISYRNLAKIGFSEFVFDGLKISDNKSGIGLFAKRAALKPDWGSGLGNMDIEFFLSNVRFVKERSGPIDTQYASISGLVTIPFDSQWTYKEIRGKVQPLSNNRLKVKAFDATSDEIRLSVSGLLNYKDNTMKLDITIYLCEKITSKIPKELSETVLTNEESGWSRFSVKLTGDCNTPSIQVSGKLFRLNIGMKERS